MHEAEKKAGKKAGKKGGEKRRGKKAVGRLRRARAVHARSGEKGGKKGREKKTVGRSARLGPARAQRVDGRLEQHGERAKASRLDHRVGQRGHARHRRGGERAVVLDHQALDARRELRGPATGSARIAQPLHERRMRRDHLCEREQLRPRRVPARRAHERTHVPAHVGERREHVRARGGAFEQELGAWQLQRLVRRECALVEQVQNPCLLYTSPSPRD